MIEKSSHIGSHVRKVLSERISPAGLPGNESSSSLRKIMFSDQESVTSTLLSNIKYNHIKFQNNNLFYLFHDQLAYRLAKYFARSRTMKSNMDKFVSEQLMTLLTEKLYYQNVDEWMEKLSEILWVIPNNKWIEYKFEYQNVVACIAGQGIAIDSQNVIGCL